MASPPYNHLSAISPPHPPHAQLPTVPKRRQSDMPHAPNPAAKKRKFSMASNISTSSHPLRQTSFPPENLPSATSHLSRSPSVDAVSMVSGVSGVKKRKPKDRRRTKDDESLVDGKSKSAGPGEKGAAGKGGASESEDEGGPEHMKVQFEDRSKEEKEKEARHRAMLTEAFDPEQWRRYEAWRSAKLPDAAVRRLINQTLSQSVPQPVILAVKSVAKIFAGQMIESARDIQHQWMEADDDAKAALPSPPAESKDLRGPLLPDHLREAYRRFRLSREGESAGQLGLWQIASSSGVERYGVKLGGKRLMK